MSQNCSRCGHDWWDHFLDESVLEDGDEMLYWGKCEHEDEQGVKDCDCSYPEEPPFTRQRLSKEEGR